MNKYLKHYVSIEIQLRDNLSMLKILHQLNINIYDIAYYPQKVVLKVEYKDLDLIGKYYKYKIKRHFNIYNFHQVFRTYFSIIMFLVLFIVLTFCISNIIVSVNVIHTKEEIRDLVYKELKNHNLKKFTIRKDFDSISKIKEEILAANPNTIEWLEIERIGMKYVVKVEERIINNAEEQKTKCNIVAKKEGVIKKIVASKGEIVVEENQYVNKDDILISNEIKFNEEVKNNVCAEGKVYANTWYSMNIKINKEYIKYDETGKDRFNLKIKTPNKEHIIFRNRLDDYKREEHKLLSIAGNELIFVKDKEVTKTNKEYTEEEIEEMINEEINDKLHNLLDNDYTIISKNILKKSENNSIMNIDVFIVVEENIATKIEIME
ncbi:MAG: sporulation protein YqfD [Bacilli bacterium]